MQIAARLRRWLRNWLLIESDNAVWSVELTRYGNRLEELKDLRRENAELIQRMQVLDEKSQITGTSHSELTKRVKFISESLSLAMQEMRKDHNETFLALRELVSATGENFKLRIEDLNKRIVDIETDKPVIAKEKEDDDDPLSGATSWASQVAAAERGTGVRN